MTPRRSAAVSAERIYRMELAERPIARLDGPNSRLHWRAKTNRKQHWLICLTVAAIEGGWPTQLPDNGQGWRVTFEVSMRRGTVDTDNKYGMLKSVRDLVAGELLGCDDKPGGIEWNYPEWTRGPDKLVITLEKVS